MILRSRRKHRTTARRITPAIVAVKFAVLLAVFAGPAIAQQPGSQLPPGYQQPLNRPASGYLLRTQSQPQPKQQPQARTEPGTIRGSGGGGKVMYFTKPADAPTVTGAGAGADPGADSGLVQVSDPARVPVPDVPARTLPVPAQPGTLPPLPAVSDMPGYIAQPISPVMPGGKQPPTTSTSEKRKQEIPPVPNPESIRLPPREDIFRARNDDELEQYIIDGYIAGVKAKPDVKINREDVQFPPLPVISPPGVVYQPKTVNYDPRRFYVEPGYVVYRRLHFEELNADRYGWDLGVIQPALSALYFYRNVLLFPNSLASGCASGFWDTNAGKCLPGSPTPLALYPPGLTITGTFFETSIITGAAFLFP